MSLDLSQYKTMVFDCDGVVLNSNKVKTQAFYDATLSFGHDKAQALVDYHILNGGVSRYLKFEYFIQRILHQPFSSGLYEQLLERFAREVKAGLLKSELARGIEELRQQTSHVKWLIVSGGDQDELREVFSARGLAEWFDGGIFGSPDNKDAILKRELENYTIKSPALFLGDSKYDYEAAHRAGLDFVFLSDWTEVKDWREYVQRYRLPAATSISCLLNVHQG
ncbi:MAG: HAD-IA family hydrolase [Thiomicrorhabdus chilensis]|uniref:HAD family hydrolase n=1 Tax=Thiomicrorhabdus chilensis TaxID=63656 RepID=UPI00299DBB7C|nr:HAD-IA family hydrolase [Thiomicrorhabdus chilensis]MDX1347274.1 HAD-IA family hydrolase [Thiomicrorhabdus chilensis]